MNLGFHVKMGQMGIRVMPWNAKILLVRVLAEMFFLELVIERLTTCVLRVLKKESVTLLREPLTQH